VTILEKAVDNFERLRWDGTPVLKGSENFAGRCELPRRAFSIFQALSDKANAVFDIRLRVLDLENASQSPRSHEASQATFTISVNVYGPQKSTSSVGIFLQKCKIYLQIPDRCEFNVPYINPQCLTPTDDKTVMTSVFDSTVTDTPRHEQSDDGGLFDELGNEEQFGEELQPTLVTTPLHRYVLGELWFILVLMPQPSHQKQALSFLLSRERGWNLSGLRRDVWRSYEDRFGWTRYGLHPYREPTGAPN
jgi:hypothetical protein